MALGDRVGCKRMLSMIYVDILATDSNSLYFYQDFSVLDFRYRNIPKLDDPGTSHNLLQHVSLLFIP